MPKSMSCVHIATARSRGHLPNSFLTWSMLLLLLLLSTPNAAAVADDATLSTDEENDDDERNSLFRLKSSNTSGGIRCNFGIASASAAKSISREAVLFVPSSVDDSDVAPAFILVLFPRCCCCSSSSPMSSSESPLLLPPLPPLLLKSNRLLN